MTRTVETAALACCAALGLVAAFAVAEPAPVVRVVDGDSLVLDGKRIRLFGIDAPEMTQTCLDAQLRTWACGVAAAAALRAIVDRSPVVTCEAKDYDKYGRTVAVCRNRDGDLGALLVARGHALDVLRYSGGAYRDHQDAARAERLGMWAGEFVSPAQWRRERGGR